MLEEKKTIKLNEEELEKVAGGDETTVPHGNDKETDKACLENLQDNRDSDN